MCTTDSVGPGIYGGKVKRDESGSVIIGRQFQNHNPEPGPVYDGTGYTAMSKALSKVSTPNPQDLSKLSTRGPSPRGRLPAGSLMTSNVAASARVSRKKPGAGTK